MTLFELTADRSFADVPATTFTAMHTLLGLAPDAGIEVLPDAAGPKTDTGPVRTSSGPAPCGHSQPTPSPSRSRCRP